MKPNWIFFSTPLVIGLEMHVGHGLGLEHDLGLGVGPSYKPCWDHITTTFSKLQTPSQNAPRMIQDQSSPNAHYMITKERVPLILESFRTKKWCS